MAAACYYCFACAYLFDAIASKHHEADVRPDCIAAYERLAKYQAGSG